MDKIKDKLHIGSNTHTTTTGTRSTGTGVHSGNTGTTGGYTGTIGTAEGATGPHSSRLANTVDPRVDSDRDGSGTTGGYTSGTTAGPHSSNLANKLDPTVNTNTGTTGNTGTGFSGTNGHNTATTGNTGFGGGLSNSTNAGPHDSNVANKLDPRVDSDLDGRGNRHGATDVGVFGASGSHATRGSGTAQNTDGPHNSDMLNKLDPRVDSDRDGSNTVGGNRTYA